MLVDAPYPDDRISSGGEETIKSRVQLQRVHPIPIVFFHLISNDIGHLKKRERGERALASDSQITCIVPETHPL